MNLNSKDSAGPIRTLLSFCGFFLSDFEKNQWKWNTQLLQCSGRLLRKRKSIPNNCWAPTLSIVRAYSHSLLIRICFSFSFSNCTDFSALWIYTGRVFRTLFQLSHFRPIRKHLKICPNHFCFPPNPTFTGDLWEMPNHLRSKAAVVAQKKNPKEMWPKHSPSRNFPAVTCSAGNLQSFNSKNIFSINKSCKI